MRAKANFFIAAIGLLFATVLLLQWATWAERVAVEDLATLVIERTALEAEVRREEHRLTTLERTRTELAQLARGPAETPPAKSSAETAAASKVVPPASGRTITDIISNDPKAEVLMLRWQRAVVALEFGPFFRTRGISPEQIRKFEDNWVKRAERDIDLRAAEKLQDETGRKAMAALRQQSKDEYEAAQAELLGPENYQRLEEYNRTEVVRNVVVLGLAGSAALEGIPLSAQQGDQLWRAALAAAAPDASAKAGEQLVRAIDWEALDAQARQILTPAQFALFQSGAALSGFGSRWRYRLDVLASRAQQAEAAGPESPTVKPSGGG